MKQIIQKEYILYVAFTHKSRKYRGNGNRSAVAWGMGVGQRGGGGVD